MSACRPEVGEGWKPARVSELTLRGLTDTHCHLDSPAFAPDFPQVLTRARRAGLVRILVPGTDLESSEQAVRLAQVHPDLRAAVGIHPHSAEAYNPAALRRLRALAHKPSVVAVGEIGLDHFRDLARRDAQRWALQAQLELAGELGLPVVVHVREAMGEVLEMLERAALGGRSGRWCGILHAFSGTRDEARQARGLGFLLGLGGTLTYPRADTQRGLFHASAAGTDCVRLDEVVLETDAPYLPPQGNRGRRNEPALVSAVAERLAGELGVPVEVVVAGTRQSAQSLLGWE